MGSVRICVRMSLCVHVFPCDNPSCVCACVCARARVRARTGELVGRAATDGGEGVGIREGGGEGGVCVCVVLFGGIEKLRKRYEFGSD